MSFQLVAHPVRQVALDVLTEHPYETVSLDRLARAISERSSEDVPDDPERVRITLHHVHLPKLADAKVVTYDQEAGTVRYAPVRPVEVLLEFATDSAGDDPTRSGCN